MQPTIAHVSRLSLVHPITILTTLPSASVGAIIALILFHSELDVISIIGIFLLIGIVKKNAIMMIDFALIANGNTARTPGMNSTSFTGNPDGRISLSGCGYPYRFNCGWLSLRKEEFISECFEVLNLLYAVNPCWRL
jgi:hypothetical protein